MSYLTTIGGTQLTSLGGSMLNNLAGGDLIIDAESPERERLRSLNTATLPKPYRFTLYNSVFGTLVLTHAPDGWKDDEFSLKRDMKKFGVFRKFSSLELKFVKEGRDYVQGCYEAYGVNCDITITVEYYSYTTGYTTRFTGKIDLSTYKINELSCDVQVIDGTFTGLLMDRASTKVDITKDVSIDGEPITDAVKSNVTIPDINIYNNAFYQLDPAVDFIADSHVMPIVLQGSTFNDGEAATPGQYLNQLAGAFFVDSVTARTDFELRLNLNIQASGTLGCNIQVDAWNGGSFRANLYDERFDGQIGEVYLEGVFDLDEGDYLLLQLISDNVSTQYRYFKCDVGTYDQLSSISSRVIYGILYREAFRAIVAHCTSQDDNVSSSIFNDVHLGVVTNGRYFRGITGTNPAISVSLNELFDSLSLFNIGMGVEEIDGVETLVIERMAYFFNNRVILDVSDRINETLIQKEVIPELYANRLKIGFDSFDYDYSGGVYEFNTSSVWSTVIRFITSEFGILSKLRGDSTGIFKAMAEPDPSKDTEADEDNYILDVVEYLSAYKARTTEGFEMVSGTTATFSMFNIDYSPARTLRRWGAFIRAFLHQNLSSSLRWQASDKNTTLETRLTGGETIEENGDVLAGDLDVNLWIPEAYTVEVPIEEGDLSLIQANPNGIIKLAENKYGWILDFKSKNDQGKQSFRLLRVNQAAVSPDANRYGLLYNAHAVNESIFGITGWHVPTAADLSTLATALGTDPTWFLPVAVGIRLDTGAFSADTTTLSVWGEEYTTTNKVISIPVGSGSSTVGNADNRIFGLNVRLIKDDSTEVATVTDWDGNVYPCLKIGSQVWMLENYRCKHYNEGTAIPEVQSGTTWGGLNTGAWCYFDNKITNG